MSLHHYTACDRQADHFTKQLHEGDGRVSTQRYPGTLTRHSITNNTNNGNTPLPVTYRDTMPINTRVTAEHNLGTLTQYRTETPDSVKALGCLHHMDTKAAVRVHYGPWLLT